MNAHDEARIQLKNARNMAEAALRALDLPNYEAAANMLERAEKCIWKASIAIGEAAWEKEAKRERPTA